MTDDSLALFERRLAALPGVLRETLACPMPPLVALREARRVTTTGIGMSEAPARLLALLLRRAGCAADFLPLSSLADAPCDAPLVVFSQAISPNVQFALCRRAMHPNVTLVTALDVPSSPTFTVLRHPPVDETGLLLRTLGPAAACIVALRIAHQVTDDPGLSDVRLGKVPDAVASAEVPDRPLADNPVAMLTACGAVDRVCLPRWTLLEALGTFDPPVWDVLQFAHGPFQSVHPSAATLLALESSAHPREASLFDRLGSMLTPARHTLLRIRSPLPHPLSLLVHHAQVSRLCLQTLRVRPRDLARWPGQGLDGPLYELQR